MTRDQGLLEENVLEYFNDMPWPCPMSSNVSSNVQKDRPSHC